jgi:hypothetical protein
MKEVIDAKYETEYKIRIKFNDGTVGIVDLYNDLWGKMFEPLKDVNVFKNFRVSEILNTIEWENGADFAPEFLFDKIINK